MIHILNLLVIQFLFIRLEMWRKEQMGYNAIAVRGFVMPITNRPLGKTWVAGWGWGR